MTLRSNLKLGSRLYRDLGEEFKAEGTASAKALK
jgi:hypothetical protein